MFTRKQFVAICGVLALIFWVLTWKIEPPPQFLWVTLVLGVLTLLFVALGLKAYLFDGPLPTSNDGELNEDNQRKMDVADGSR